MLSCAKVDHTHTDSSSSTTTSGTTTTDNTTTTDTTAPTVYSTYPSNSASSVAPNTSLTVTFSEAMYSGPHK